jgi:hypothetical protein
MMSREEARELGLRRMPKELGVRAMEAGEWEMRQKKDWVKEGDAVPFASFL